MQKRNEKTTIIICEEYYMMNIWLNMNPYDDSNKVYGTGFTAKYFVEDYCKKYPDDRGNQIIYAEDMVRPRNHKWASQAEQVK
jgi:hypothetical protein